MVNEFDYITSISNTLEGDSWIAVIDNKVVASGKNSKEVFKKVKTDYPNKEPFIMKALSDSTMLFLVDGKTIKEYNKKCKVERGCCEK